MNNLKELSSSTNEILKIEIQCIFPTNYIDWVVCLHMISLESLEIVNRLLLYLNGESAYPGVHFVAKVGFEPFKTTSWL